MNASRFYMSVLVLVCGLGWTTMARADCYSSSSGCYGSGLGADSLGNTVLGGQFGNVVSYRLLASHTGSLQSILVYLIPNHAGYAAGTGGTIRVTVNTDDGTAAHNPSSTVLTTYTITNYQTLTPSVNFPVLTFPVAPSLTAGQIYHIVLTNVDASPTVNYLSVDALYQSNPGATTQPTDSDMNCAVLMKQGTNAWTERKGFTPVIMMNYTDGTQTGVGYMEVWSGAPEPASGSSAVREALTVSGSARTVTSVSVRAELASGSDPLVVRLEDGAGNLIEQGNIPATAFTTGAYAWATYTFASAHTLGSGQSYNLHFEAASTSTYQLSPIRKGYAYGFSNATYFPDGYAEFQTNGGSWAGWTQWGVTNRADGDLQFYFTLSGFSPAALISTGPVVSNAGATTAVSATVNWTTDQSSTSQVEYGTTTSYTNVTPVSTTMVTNHSVSLAGLATGTLYHYVVLSRNTSGEQTVSGDLTFTTP